jgi:hypothetical protein
VEDRRYALLRHLFAKQKVQTKRHNISQHSTTQRNAMKRTRTRSGMASLREISAERSLATGRFSTFIDGAGAMVYLRIIVYYVHRVCNDDEQDVLCVHHLLLHR